MQLLELCLRIDVAAVECQGAVVAFWAPGSAGIPPELNQTVAEIVAFLRREDGPKLPLYLFRICAFRKAQFATDADAVGVTYHTAGNSIQVAEQ